MSREKLLINNPKSNNSEDMSNKQIEDIDELETVLYEANHKRSVLDYRWLATEAYNAGYRKQSEGEWIEHGNWAGSIEYKCTACEETTFHAQYYAFCPNCGAKMKGGAE